MKKFLIKITVFLVLLSALILLAGWVNLQIDPVERNSSLLKFDAVPQQIHYAVFGSSHAQNGVDFTDLADSYFNFSLPGQSPRYDFQMMKEYEDRIEDGAVIVLINSYMSPFWTDYPTEFEEKQTTYYYKVLSPRNIIDFQLGEYLNIRLPEEYPVFRIFHTDLCKMIPLLIEKLKTSKPEVSAPPSENSSPDSNAPETAPSEPLWNEDMEHARKGVITGHFSRIQPTFPNMNPGIRDSYDGIFRMAEKHHWKVVFVTPPFPAEYNEMFDTPWDGQFEKPIFPEFQSHIRQMAQAHGVPYWDYSHDPDFSDHPELFSDISHLNGSGQAKFSKILFDRLQHQFSSSQK